MRRFCFSVWQIAFVLLYLICIEAVSVYGAEEIPQERFIRVGFFEFPGYHEQTEDNIRSGFGYDVLRELQPYTNWRYEYVGYDEGWSHMLDMLENEEIDLLSSAVKTPEKLKRFDYSQYPLGMSSTILTFKAGQTKYKPKDYENWNNLRVGMIPNNSKNEVFLRFAKEHDIHHTSVYFEDVSELEEALQKGDVDAIVTGSLRRLENEVIFEKMAEQPFYFIVKKGNQDLLDELDNALEHLFMDKPNILKELYSDHYEIRKIHAVCPLFIDESNEQERHLTKYIQEYLQRVGQINHWDISIDLEESLAHDEFLESKDIICGLIKNEEYQKSLDFPLQPVGTFKTILLSREDNEAFIKNNPKNWPNKIPIKIGYAPCTLGCTNKLQRFAEQYLLKYKTIEFSADTEAIQALKDGKIDLVVTAQLQKLKGIEVAAVCGESSIYFAVPHGKEDIYRLLSQTIEHIKIYEQPFLDDLAFRYLDQPLPTDKRVRVCIYEEKLSGYDGEYINRLAKISGWNVDYINTPYAAAHQYLLEGKVDIVPSTFYTDERARYWLYSNQDFGVIYFFLATSLEGSKMQPNQFATWDNARIAVPEGSTADVILARFLNQYGIHYSFHYYDTLAQAEKSVLDGTNDAVYTCAPQGLKPLAVFPSELTYLCINKDKPWLKDEIDRGMAYLQRNDPHFRQDLMDKNFPTYNSDILMLNEEEIEKIKSFKNRKIRVDISPEIPPLKVYNPTQKKAIGFASRLFDQISHDTGLKFEYLPPATSEEARRRLLHGESDIWVGFGGDIRPLGETVISRSSIYLPQVKVFNKNKGDIESEHAKVAITEDDYALRKFFGETLSETNIILCPDRHSCYQAVEYGKADYTIDSLQAAQYTLWNQPHHHSGLVFRSTLPNEFDDPMRFIYSVNLDESVRNVIDRTLKSFTQDQLRHYLQSATFTGIKKPILTPMQLAILIAALVTAALLAILLIFYRNNMQQKKQLVMQKSTTDCLETLLLENQNIEKAIKAIIAILVRSFNAQMGWYARYDEDGIYLESMVGFDREIDPSCLKALPLERYEEWKHALAKGNIHLMQDCCKPDALGIREWDSYLYRKQIKTICTACVKQKDIVRGNVAICFNHPHCELTPMELNMLKYFQHVMEAALNRKEILQNLMTERDRAVQAEKAKSFFFACVSHDIRTPLNAIIGFSELLKYGNVEPELMETYLENIAFSGNVLMELVNNMLDLSKLDTGSMVYTYDFCDFKELGTQVIKAFSHRAADGNLELKMEFQPRMPALKLDSQRVYQILFNLIGNAVKFTRQGSVTLKASCQPVEGDPAKRDLIFSVHDTGIGIEKKYFKAIFKPFQQIQNMTQTGGTGLGLSICTLMVEQMGGTISVDSEVGKGSVFTVKLNNVDSKPLERTEEEELPVEKKEEKTIHAASSVSLLMVDDVLMNLKVLEALCKKAGVTDIVKAQSGDEALEILKERRFTAVLTDMWMPGMSGAEFAKHVQTQYKGLPIYLITADTEFLKHYQEEGFSGCLTKPVTSEKLKEILQKIQ